MARTGNSGYPPCSARRFESIGKGTPALSRSASPTRSSHFVATCLPTCSGSCASAAGGLMGSWNESCSRSPTPFECPIRNELRLSDEAKAGWVEVIERLRARELATPSEGCPHPHPVTLSPEAKAEWVAWYNAHADEVNAPGFDSSELAAEGKLCDFAGRLALILHLLHLACDPTHGAADPIPPLNRSAVQGAIRLWAYFRSHHRRARWSMDGGIGNPVARSIVEWLKRTQRDHFTVKELTDDLRWLSTRHGGPEAALLFLENHHAIRRRIDPDRPEAKRGRKPSPVYDVHPALLSR